MIKTDALIIGAGPTGLFTAHQLKLIGLNCEVVDNLDKIGGQCIELYPDKPIYDIPAVPECTGEELTNNLLNQLKPFKINFHLNERVDEVKKVDDQWQINTNKGKTFFTPNVICFFIISDPGSLSSILFFDIAHFKFASMGVVFMSISFPYKQSPASNRNVSLAPKPINLDPLSNKTFVKFSAISFGIETSNPSSPV